MMNPTLPVLVFPLCKLTHWIGNTICEPEQFIFIYLCHSYLKHLVIFIKWLSARQGNKGTFFERSFGGCRSSVNQVLKNPLFCSGGKE